jgi:hypothetical protein
MVNKFIIDLKQCLCWKIRMSVESRNDRDKVLTVSSLGRGG